MPAQRQASAFQITFGSDRAWCALTASLAVLAGGALLAAPLLLPGACWLGWRCIRTRATSLRWDGQQWWLDETPVHPRVVIDLDSWLLLRLAVRSCLPRCLPLARTRCVAHWSPLRATLHSARTVPSPEP